MESRTNHKEEIERGMQLAASKPDVMPDQASEQISPIYEDIQRTLRVPLVNLIFRTLANYPDYFEPIWKELSPAFRTKVFEKEADSLRGMALLKPIPDSSGVKWESLAETDRLRAFNDTIYYVLPKLLLVTTAFYEASFGSRLEGDGQPAKAHDSSALPLGVAEGTTKVQMVDPEEASAQVRELFTSIKEKHGHPLVSSYYRGIANWPDFLEEAWSRIQPLVGSSAYEERKQELIEKALSGIRNLPVPKTEKLEMGKEQGEEIKLILTAFQHKFIPEMLLDVALIKAMLDGKEAASSRFSVAG
jgi:hypothetical protein